MVRASVVVLVVALLFAFAATARAAAGPASIAKVMWSTITLSGSSAPSVEAAGARLASLGLSTRGAPFAPLLCS